MKLSHRLFALFLMVGAAVSAQQKEVTLEEIWNGTFRTERMESLQSLKNGKEYVVLNFDRSSRTSSIDVYSYEPGKKTGTLVNSGELDEIDSFRSFELSDDEKRIILATEVQPIFRRSTRGTYYVYNVDDRSVQKIRDDKIQEPTLSPDNTKVAYVFENNIYIKDLDAEEVTQVTTDGKKNEIIHGITDWVYEEAFGFVQAFQWDGNGNKLAFLRFDETDAPEFSMDMYGNELYPTQTVFKYPKAGEKNSIVSLHLYDLPSAKTSEVGLEDYEYIPRIKWTNDASILSVQTLNRHQNNLNLIFVNADTNVAKVVLNETDEAYVDITDNLTF